MFSSGYDVGLELWVEALQAQRRHSQILWAKTESAIQKPPRQPPVVCGHRILLSLWNPVGQSYTCTACQVLVWICTAWDVLQCACWAPMFHVLHASLKWENSVVSSFWASDNASHNIPATIAAHTRVFVFISLLGPPEMQEAGSLQSLWPQDPTHIRLIVEIPLFMNHSYCPRL